MNTKLNRYWLQWIQDYEGAEEWTPTPGFPYGFETLEAAENFAEPRLARNDTIGCNIIDRETMRIVQYADSGTNKWTVEKP